MASEVTICNRALSFLGHTEITALDATDRTSRLCRLHYTESRDALLAMHQWNFAVRRVALAAIVNVPVFEYSTAFGIPEDCVKIIRTSIDSEETRYPYRREAVLDTTVTPNQLRQCIVTDATELSLEYIARVTDPNAMSVLFREALSAKLAAEMCVALTDSASRASQLAQTAQDKVRLAMSTDAQEGTPREIYTNDWLDSREGGSWYGTD